MFDLGFWELIVIAVLSLIIIGPERLPSFIKSLGYFVKKIKNVSDNIKTEVVRELDACDIESTSKCINEIKENVKSLEK